MKRWIGKFAIVALSIVAISAECKTSIKITCRAKGMELALCKEAIDEWIALHNNKYNVEIVTLPHASNECFALYQQWLSAGSFDVDILQMDVAWIGSFAEHLSDLEVLSNVKIDTSDYFDAIRESMTYQGSILAMPWYTDCGVMYYRSDLLKKYDRTVPRTWDELFDTALYIQQRERGDVQKKNRFYGLVLQAKAFEVLTCNFTEVLDSFGGAIVAHDQASINSEASVAAVHFLIKCLRNITSQSVLNYSEEDARGMFQSGNAVFMRNWPYAWSLLNEPSTVVAGKVGVMPIPPKKLGGKTSGVLGGWFLAVSKHSKHGAIAADLVRYLTSVEQQRKRAQHSYLPTFKSLYRDSFVLKHNPFFSEIYKSLENAVARPSAQFGATYPRASTNIFNMINTILSENIEESSECDHNVRKMLDRLNRRLNTLLEKNKRSINGSSESKKGFRQRIADWFSDMSKWWRDGSKG